MAELDLEVARMLASCRPAVEHNRALSKVYDRAYEVYRAARDPQATAKRRPWQSDIRVPYGMQVVDTATVNVVSGAPRAKVKPRKPQDLQGSQAMQTLLDYHVDRDRMAEKQPVFVQQAFVYGTTCAKNHWRYRTTTRLGRRFSDHPYQPSEIVTDQTVVLYDGPTFEPWDIYDVMWEPNARDVDTAAYVILRSWLTVEELRRNSRSEQNPYGMFEPDAVAQMVEQGPAGRPQVTSRDRLMGASQQTSRDRFEVWEIWQDESYACLGNQNVMLAAPRPNPYWHQHKPVVISQPRPDIFLMHGIPETQLLDDLQQALWTLQNMRIDNMHLTVQRGVTYRETMDPNVIEVQPRFKIPVTDHDDVQFVSPPPLPPEAYREDESLIGKMERVTGISSYVSGSDLQTVDQKTATGVTALQEVAGRLLRFKARQLAYQGYQRTFWLWSEMVQQFTTEEQAIRIEGPDGYSWTHVSPQDLVGDFDISVEGTEESLSRQQERGEAIALLNAFAPLAPLGIVNFRPILERIAEAYDFPSAEVLLQPQQSAQQPPAAPTQGGGLAAQPVSSAGLQPQQAPPQLDPRLLAALNGRQG